MNKKIIIMTTSLAIFVFLFMNFSPSEFFLFSVIMMVIFVFIAMMKNWFHTIMILMLLEMVMILSYMSLVSLISMSLSIEVVFLFSTLMVTEASMSMALLAKISRTHGNDYMLIF